MGFLRNEKRSSATAADFSGVRRPSAPDIANRPARRAAAPGVVGPVPRSLPEGSANDSCNRPAFDVNFSVPLVHRLRFTHDVFGVQRQVLADILEPSGHPPARVQFWLDANVARAHPAISQALREFSRQFAGRVALVGRPHIVPGGEAVKNDLRNVERMLAEFHAAGLDRRSYVVAVGGGAVLDAVGFAAAIAHRGIRLVRLPTTTLAQADSAIGVKNGVNLFRTKNWLGAFSAPWAVINDARLLETLTDRDFRAGFSEALKVALLKDPVLFGQLCRMATRIARRDMPVCLTVIRRAAELHLEHITRGGDPFETLEARPLDFGHWSAHRLEELSEFELGHGEAVAIGIAIDTAYSALLLGLPPTDAARVLTCVAELGFVPGHPMLDDIESVWVGLEQFRQHLGGRLTVTMLKAVGRPVDIHRIDRALMRCVIESVQRFARNACEQHGVSCRPGPPAPRSRLARTYPGSM